MADGFTHLDEQGNARMVDVGHKDVTVRVATAVAEVTIAAEVRRKLFAGDLPKGDALGVARVAAIMAAKQTPNLVPLCHPIPICWLMRSTCSRLCGLSRISESR